MTSLPISNPKPQTRETLFSYAARLAATWQTDTRSLLQDMGVSITGFVNLRSIDVEKFADWSGLDSSQMHEIASWTGVSTGAYQTLFRGEIFRLSSLRAPVMRGCPVCLRTDEDGAIFRGDWQYRDASVCLEHQHCLVALWKETNVFKRSDIRARLPEIMGDVRAGQYDQPLVTLSDYDRWLYKRLCSNADDTDLRQKSTQLITTLSGLLGQALLSMEEATLGNTVRRAQAVGFAALVGYPDTTREALDRLVGAVAADHDRPTRALRKLYIRLAREHVKDSEFDWFCDLLRERMTRWLPIGDGDVLLGKPNKKRLVHSVRSAAVETNIRAHTIKLYLVEAGIMDADDPRPDRLKLFDAKAHAAFLEEIQNLVGYSQMREILGATQSELKAILADGLLTPFATDTRIKKRWGRQDCVDLVSRFSSDNTITVNVDDPHWERLLAARKRTGLDLGTLIDAIDGGRLPTGRAVGEVGFHDVLVPKSKVDEVYEAL